MAKEKKTKAQKKAARKAAREDRREQVPSAQWAAFAIVVFEVSAFLLLALQGGGAEPAALCMAALVPALFCVQFLLLAKLYPHMDRYLFMIVHFLCGIGILLLFRFDHAMGFKQFLAYILGCIAQIVAMVALARYKAWWKLRYAIMGASLALLLLVIFLGKEKNGATNWLRLGPLSVQPSEFVKLALIMVMALYLTRAQKLRQLLPAGLFAVACVALLVIQKDLGAVLIYFAVAILMYYVATSDWVLSLVGLVAAGGGAALCYKLFNHVRVRVQIWRNPWATSSGSGYQIVQGLIAIGSGGFFGLGLGQGLPRAVPVYESDFIFAVLCEEFGVLMGFCVLALYVLLIVRGATIALRSRERFPALVAFGVAALLAVQTFLIVGGVINLIPLTGVTLPFISSGGSSMVACLAMMGMLQGVAIDQGQAEALAWKRARRTLRAREGAL